jgi:hypothetical protein
VGSIFRGSAIRHGDRHATPGRAEDLHDHDRQAPDHGHPAQFAAKTKAPTSMTDRRLDEALARIGVLENTVALLVAALKQPTPGDAGEDGQPRRWLRLNEAVAETGYSLSGLRKLMREGKVRVRRRGPHPTIDVDSIPRRAG